MEICYLKRLNYYDGLCKKCSGTDENICYSTKADLQGHLDYFNRLFAQQLETSPIFTEEEETDLPFPFRFEEQDETLDEMFEVHEGGFL